MNKKHLYLIVFIIYFVVLSGCNGAITPATDEAKIKSVIQNYGLALNDQNWSKAKSYCVYGSEAYYQVCVKEDLVNALSMYCNIITLTYFVDIISVDITGNYAQVYIHTTSLITACGYAEDFDLYEYGYLQKIGTDWKIYGGSEA